MACAEASDWERLAKLEQTRLPIFNQVFSHGIANNEELARKILLADEKMMALAKAGIPVLKKELLLLRSSGKANSAYQAIQGIVSIDG